MRSLFVWQQKSHSCVFLDTGGFPQTCLPCSSETFTTHACPSAGFQSTCLTPPCWTSIRSWMLTCPLTFLKYVTQTKYPGTNVHLFSWAICFSLRSACWLWGFCLSLRQSSPPSPRYDPQSRLSSTLWSYTQQHKVRCVFSVQGEENVEPQPVFALCLHAELVPATVQDYREKLLHLRKLRHDLVQRSLPQGPPTTFQQVWSIYC